MYSCLFIVSEWILTRQAQFCLTGPASAVETFLGCR
jgi:hypothetical protein